MVLFNKKLEEIVQLSDRKKSRDRVKKDLGYPGTARLSGSPERFVSYYFWREFIETPNIWAFKFQGWEPVDGHRCARVRINKTPELKSEKAPRYLFWVDLERGGHILREEFLNGDDLWYRVDKVELKQFPLPGGGSAWFPIHGEYSTFLNGARFKTTPVLREVYNVVRGTLLLNQGLGDERFSLKWRGHVDARGFQAARKDFLDAPSKPEPAPLRTDPAGVQEYQRAKLAEAERQAGELDASPPAARFWSPDRIYQAGFMAFGLTGAGAAIVWKRRQQRNESE